MDPGTRMNALPAFLYGDAVLVGQDADGALADVPGRFLDPGHLGWSFEPAPFDFPMPPLISSPVPAAARTGRTAPLPRLRADRRRGSR